MKYYWRIITTLMSFSAYAVHAEVVNPINVGLPGENVDSFRGATTLMTKIVEKGLDITAMTGIIAICIVGYMFITSDGNDEKRNKAIKYAGIIGVGVLIAASAYGIIALVNQIPNSLR